MFAPPSAVAGQLPPGGQYRPMLCYRGIAQLRILQSARRPTRRARGRAPSVGIVVLALSLRAVCAPPRVPSCAVRTGTKQLPASGYGS